MILWFQAECPPLAKIIIHLRKKMNPKIKNIFGGVKKKGYTDSAKCTAGISLFLNYFVIYRSLFYFSIRRTDPNKFNGLVVILS